MKPRQEYQGLSKQELMDKAHELACTCDQYSHSCSQCTVAAIHKLLGFDDVVVRVASSCAGGQVAQVIGTCGSLIGCTIVLDYFFGRPVEEVSYSEVVNPPWESMRLGKMLYDKFIGEYGSILCPHIQVKLFGRHYYVLDPDDMKKFEEVGGHLDKCPQVCGKAARWTMEILLNEGAIEL